MALSVVDFQVNGVSHMGTSTSAHSDDSFYDWTVLPVAVGDIFIFMAVYASSGGGNNFFIDYGAGYNPLIIYPFSHDGAITPFGEGTSLAGASPGVTISMGFHVIDALDLDDGMANATIKNGWLSSANNFHGGGFAGLIVRGATNPFLITSASEGDPGPTMTSPQTYSPGTWTTVPSNSLMIAIGGIQDDSGIANTITTTDNVSLTGAADAADTWLNAFGRNNFGFRAGYALPGVSIAGMNFEFTASTGSFAQNFDSSRGGMTMALVGFDAATASASDAWAWQT